MCFQLFDCQLGLLLRVIHDQRCLRMFTRMRLSVCSPAESHALRRVGRLLLQLQAIWTVVEAVVLATDMYLHLRNSRFLYEFALTSVSRRLVNCSLE